MSSQNIEVRFINKPRHVLSLDSRVLPVPEDWALLPPGDAALSRRIKEDGPTWTVIEPKGRKRFSKGIWAPAARIEALRAQLAIEREDPSYSKKLEASRRRREAEQVEYVEDFTSAVQSFLAFHPVHRELETKLALLIARHATPVGSGTVARTERIPLEERAEAAVIAWMRHQTTAYDSMAIPHIKGARREVRRMLAERSRFLLERYRRELPLNAAPCPLAKAVADSEGLK